MLSAPYAPNGIGLHAFRSASYERAYAEIGLDAREYLHECDWQGDDYELSKKKLVKALREHPEITALIAPNDYDAQFQHQALVQGGYRVPDDISLISYDDTNAISDPHGENILTTVRAPLHEIGYQGTKLIVARTTGQEKQDRDVVLPVELIVRKSTAPAR
jgi:LacI family transcriptional regulator